MPSKLGVFALTLSLGTAIAGTAGATEATAAKCSAATLQGTYLYSYTGTVVSGKGSGPYAYAGYDMYDGNGHINGFGTSSTNGKIVRRAHSTGTYKLFADCSGTLTYTDGSTYDFFAAPDGSTNVFVQTNPGSVATGTEHKVAAP